MSLVNNDSKFNLDPASIDDNIKTGEYKRTKMNMTGTETLKTAVVAFS